MHSFVKSLRQILDIVQDPEQSVVHEESVSELGRLLSQVNAQQDRRSPEPESNDELDEEPETLDDVLKEIPYVLAVKIEGSDEGMVSRACLVLAEAFNIPSIWSNNEDAIPRILKALVRLTSETKSASIRELCDHISRTLVKTMPNELLFKHILQVTRMDELNRSLAYGMDLIRTAMNKWPLSLYDRHAIELLDSLKAGLSPEASKEAQINSAACVWLYVEAFPELGAFFVSKLTPDQYAIVCRSCCNPNLREMMHGQISKIQSFYRHNALRDLIRRRLREYVRSHDTGEDPEAYPTTQTDIPASRRALGDFYVKGHTLGKGVFSTICFCKEKSTSVQRAIKIVKKASMSLHHVLKREYQECSRLPCHPNLINVMDAFETDNAFMFVLDTIMDGQLFETLSRLPKLSESIVRDAFHQLLEGIAFLHQHGVAACDLSPSHVLASVDPSSGNLRVKIIVFSLSKHIPTQHIKQMLDGTAECMAPEISSASSSASSSHQLYSPKNDMWSIGCILFQMLTGNAAFERRKSGEQDDAADVSSVVGIDVSDEAKHLLSCLLRCNPDRRITISEALDHEWFRAPLLVSASSCLDHTKTQMVSTSYHQRQTRRILTRIMNQERLLPVLLMSLNGSRRQRSSTSRCLQQPKEALQQHHVLSKLQNALHCLGEHYYRGEAPENALRFVAEILRFGKPIADDDDGDEHHQIMMQG